MRILLLVTFCFISLCASAQTTTQTFTLSVGELPPPPHCRDETFYLPVKRSGTDRIVEYEVRGDWPDVQRAIRGGDGYVSITRCNTAKDTSKLPTVITLTVKTTRPTGGSSDDDGDYAWGCDDWPFCAPPPPPGIAIDTISPDVKVSNDGTVMYVKTQRGLVTIYLPKPILRLPRR